MDDLLAPPLEKEPRPSTTPQNPSPTLQPPFKRVELRTRDGVIMTLIGFLSRGGEGDIFVAERNGHKFLAKEFLPYTNVVDPSTISEHIRFRITGSKNNQYARAVQRFILSSRLMAELSDRGFTARVIDLIETDKRYFLLLKPYLGAEIENATYGDSLSLNNLIPTLSVKEKFSIIRQMVNLVVELHKMGIYHCDIKPANLIYYDGHLMFIDLTSCIDQRKNVAADTRIPDPIYTSLTVRYSSPERARSMSSHASKFVEDYDIYASEIFSLGITALEVITGQNILEDESTSYVLDLLANFHLDDPNLGFDRVIDNLQGYTTNQKSLIKEAFRLILVNSPTLRKQNFPDRFLAKLEGAFTD